MYSKSNASSTPLISVRPPRYRSSPCPVVRVISIYGCYLKTTEETRTWSRTKILKRLFDCINQLALLLMLLNTSIAASIKTLLRRTSEHSNEYKYLNFSSSFTSNDPFIINIKTFFNESWILADGFRYIFFDKIIRIYETAKLWK